jgi:pimeloyl-ACP methyl ester carboxylesterase
MRRLIADLDVNYEMTGSNRPVILVHGAGADLLTWEGIVPSLASEFTVWRMDQRGFGKTIRPPVPKLSLSVWTTDLVAFMDEFGIDRAAIVGWSMGGAVALNVATLYPERATHIITIGSPGPVQVVQDKSGFEARQRMADAGATVHEIVDATFDFTKAAFSRWSRDHNPAAVEMMRQTLLRNDARNYGEMVDALDGLSAFGPRLGAVSAPTLIICGDEDGRTPPALSRALHEAIRTSRLEIIPDCGHYYPFEKPAETAQLIANFLREAPGRTA